MTIHQGVLDKHGEKYILMDGNQTLEDACQSFQESGYSESETYLVVSLPDNKYRVCHFFQLAGILETVETDDWMQPLSTTLPIQDANWVEHVNTKESGIGIVNRVRSTPNSTLVVIDDDGFVGLLANTDMTGESTPRGRGVLESYDEYNKRKKKEAKGSASQPP